MGDGLVYKTYDGSFCCPTYPDSYKVKLLAGAGTIDSGSVTGKGS
jgi:hypothetical protein